MGTTAQVLYGVGSPSTWDGTSPASGDVRRFDDDQPGDSTGDTSSKTSHGTDANSIVVDPYTTRSTTGTTDQDKFGWAVDVSGDEGMGGTATSLRFIPAGVWSFVTHLQRDGVVPSTSNYTVQAHVYRISSDGTTRSLLFSSNVSAEAIAGNTLTGFSFSSASQSEFTFAANESLLVSYTVTKVSTSVLADTINFATGRALVGASQANLCTVTVPSPGIRTRHLETVTINAISTASATDGHKTVEGVVYDSTGAAVSGATVKLFNQSTDSKISERTTGADGAYVFTRTDIDSATYYVVGFNGDMQHGTSDRGLSAT